MKIINREKFLKMPYGTVYAKYKPFVFEELCIKEESLEDDWFYSDIVDAIDLYQEEGFEEILLRAEKTGNTIHMDFHTLCRDGCFDPDQLFAVFEIQDVKALIYKLSVDCINEKKEKQGE